MLRSVLPSKRGGSSRSVRKPRRAGPSWPTLVSTMTKSPRASTSVLLSTCTVSATPASQTAACLRYATEMRRNSHSGLECWNSEYHLQA